MFNQHAVNVPETTSRPKTAGYQNLNASSSLRRPAAYPTSGTKHDPKNLAPPSPWWLDGLNWFGFIALQFAGVFLMTSNKRNAKATFSITGCGTSIAVFSSDLFACSAICSSPNDNTAWNHPYHHARILWVRAHLHPSAYLGKRGGFYAVAMVPVQCVMEGVVVDDVPYEFELLALQPGAIVRPVTDPISVDWSPDYQWTDFGDATEKASGTNPACVLAIAYSDPATDDDSGISTDQEEYVPTCSLIKLHLEGQVAVRRPGLLDTAASMIYSDGSLIQVRDHDNTCSIPYDAVL
jgi:hypothetical protein